MPLVIKYFHFYHLKRKIGDRLWNKLFERKLSTWWKVERPKWVAATTSPSAEHRTGPALHSVFSTLFSSLCHSLTKIKKHKFSSHSKKGNWVFVGRNTHSAVREDEREVRSPPLISCVLLHCPSSALVSCGLLSCSELVGETTMQTMQSA